MPRMSLTGGPRQLRDLFLCACMCMCMFVRVGVYAGLTSEVLFKKEALWMLTRLGTFGRTRETKVVASPIASNGDAPQEECSWESWCLNKLDV